MSRPTTFAGTLCSWFVIIRSYNRLVLIKDTHPFFYPGNQVACLLVHGFTSSPSEMSLLGESLALQGYSVLAIRLFAHGTRYQDMRRARWQDWIANLEDGWHILNGETRPVIIVGFSLGGSLALYFAAHFPVQAVISIAAPHHLPKDPRLPFLKIMSFFIPYLYSSKPPVWFDQSERHRHIRYPNDSTRALAEVHEFLSHLQVALPKVTAPALLIYSKNDPTVTAREQHMEKFAQAIRSPIKQTMILEQSGHILPLDAQRGVVIQACLDFIQQVLSGHES